MEKGIFFIALFIYLFFLFIIFKLYIFLDLDFAINS